MMFKYQGEQLRAGYKKDLLQPEGGQHRELHLGQPEGGGGDSPGRGLEYDAWESDEETTPQPISEEEISHNVKPSNAWGSI